jgi:hypothetical protein
MAARRKAQDDGEEEKEDAVFVGAGGGQMSKAHIHPELYVLLDAPKECLMCETLTTHAEDVGAAAPLCSEPCADKFWSFYWGNIKNYRVIDDFEY